MRAGLVRKHHTVGLFWRVFFIFMFGGDRDRVWVWVWCVCGVPGKSPIWTHLCVCAHDPRIPCVITKTIPEAFTHLPLSSSSPPICPALCSPLCWCSTLRGVISLSPRRAASICRQYQRSIALSVPLSAVCCGARFGGKRDDAVACGRVLRAGRTPCGSVRACARAHRPAVLEIDYSETTIVLCAAAVH